MAQTFGEIYDSSFTVQMHEYRCTKCGRFFATENGLGDYVNCPNCEHNRSVENYNDCKREERRVVSLRGVITKMKRARK